MRCDDVAQFIPDVFVKEHMPGAFDLMKSPSGNQLGRGLAVAFGNQRVIGAMNGQKARLGFGKFCCQRTLYDYTPFVRSSHRLARNSGNPGQNVDGDALTDRTEPMVAGRPNPGSPVPAAPLFVATRLSNGSLLPRTARRDRPDSQ